MFREDCITKENEAVTYSLRAGGNTSHNYYRDIAALADEVLADRRHGVDPLLERYMDWVRRGRHEQLRTDLEYTADLLCLGVMWQLYGGRARRVPAPGALLLSGLYRLRRRVPRWKPRVDRIRGALGARLLGPGCGADEGEGVPSMCELRALLRWMDATGEYREEAKRLRLLLSYLASCDSVVRSWYLINLLAFAAHFTLVAEKRLHRYTAGVERFLTRRAPEHAGREDALLVSRRVEEYHLSMLQAELMNRAFGRAYGQTHRRAILLPACMRGSCAASCRARREDLDMVCTGCNPGCRVHTLTRLAARRGVTAHIIPHSSDFSRWLRSWAAGKDIGVIGVACVLHLVTGGLELRAEGIPAQCVLLDFCGCSQHWDPDGRQTDLNEEKLFEMLAQPA